MRAKQWKQGVTIGILVLVIAWLASLIWGLFGKTAIALRQANETRVQYAALEERRRVLEADLEALHTPRGQEAAIRESFGVAKPGEEVIVLVQSVTATGTPPLPWWRRIFDW